MDTIRRKRGDTLSLRMLAKDADGEPYALDDVTIRSQVRRGGQVTQELTVTMGPGAGEFYVSATAAQTAAWPVSRLKCDVQFTWTSDGFVESSPTIEIDMYADETFGDAP